MGRNPDPHPDSSGFERVSSTHRVAWGIRIYAACCTSSRRCSSSPSQPTRQRQRLHQGRRRGAALHGGRRWVLLRRRPCVRRQDPPERHQGCGLGPLRWRGRGRRQPRCSVQAQPVAVSPLALHAPRGWRRLQAAGWWRRGSAACE
ncbi:hypothetical protein PR202_gb19718 [Eleusine coracana subsp. coracana]|uniref:Uncharacterized protein n=1 Tax=Eleusine coracana subsp. coracana TaxID=191504 RepID=A0AAV5F8Z1_ELECO|nr:hypothetical protein PR202_gb19718 [Eleusine coracana subsp. coracana]